MELAFITLRFDSPEEQKYVEEHVAYMSVWEHETWNEDSGNQSWTEFDISGCEPHDIQFALDEVMRMWEYHKDGGESIFREPVRAFLTFSEDGDSWVTEEEKELNRKYMPTGWYTKEEFEKAFSAMRDEAKDEKTKYALSYYLTFEQICDELDESKVEWD